MKSITRREAIMKSGLFILGTAACSTFPGLGIGCSQNEMNQEKVRDLMNGIRKAAIDDIRLTVVYANETLPHKVLTNSTYDDSLEYLAKDETPNPDRFKSIERFILAANSLKGYEPETVDSPLEYSFSLLEKVSWTVKRKTWTSRTQWSVVYDVKNLQVYFKTYTNPEIRHINLEDVNFSCASPVKVLDVNDSLSGDVSTVNFC